jgi:hypothetical protein
MDSYSVGIDPQYCGRIYRPSFHEKKPKTLVFSQSIQAFCACFRKNWVYKFRHWCLCWLMTEFARNSSVVHVACRNFLHLIFYVFLRKEIERVVTSFIYTTTVYFSQCNLICDLYCDIRYGTLFSSNLQRISIVGPV